MEKPVSENQQEFANEVYYVAEHYIKQHKLNYIEIIGILELLKDSYPNRIAFCIRKPEEIHNE